MNNKALKNITLTAVMGALLALPVLVAAADGDQEELVIKLPSPSFKAKVDWPGGPNIQAPLTRPPKPLMVPKGCKNVALKKPVTASVEPITGELELVTDGSKDAIDGQIVIMRKGSQWVQVDLGQEQAIYVVALWHDHTDQDIFHDVIIQVADDAEFTKNVRTLFNNDDDNSAGRGAGSDKEYYEQYYGKVIEAKGVKARYLRAYSNGNTSSKLNAIQEIEVYGK